MSIILTHGTSGNRAEDIITNGFGNDKKTVWDCSDDSVTYFYELDKYVEFYMGEDLEEVDDIEKEAFLNEMIRTSNNNAQITSAFEKNAIDKTVVFEIIIDEKEVDIDYIETDYSCENMEAAVTIPDDILNEWIKEKKVTVKVHEFGFCPKISLLYLTGFQDSDYLKESMELLSEVELLILKSLRKTYIEEIYDVEEINTYYL